MLHFSRFLFLINFLRHMHSICVWNMIKQNNPLQTKYDRTNIYDRCYIRTHIYVFLFSVKKSLLELSRVWPWRWSRRGTQYTVFIGPVFHNTIKTCLKREGHGGYEWVEKRNVSVCSGHELANALYIVRGKYENTYWIVCVCGFVRNPVIRFVWCLKLWRNYMKRQRSR